MVPGWVTNAIAYLDQTLPANGGKAISSQRLWVVVEGFAPPKKRSRGNWRRRRAWER